MKYPRLQDKDNLSRKLSDTDIQHIQESFQQDLSHGYTATGSRNKLAQQYHVTYSTIYYWTNDNFRQAKRKKDNAYWSQQKIRDPDNWYVHKKQEITRRKARMQRNPDLKLWHAVVTAKNEKRCTRKTLKGKPLQDYQ